MLGKLQSIWRRSGFAGKSGSDASQARVSADPPGAQSGTLATEVEALEQKVAALLARFERLDHSVQDLGDLQPLRNEWISTQSRVGEQDQRATRIDASLQSMASAQEQIRIASGALAERLQRQTERLTESNERADELARRIEYLQMNAQGLSEAVTGMRDELMERDTARARDVGGRILGLYVIASVALTVALATLIIVISRVGL